MALPFLDQDTVVGMLFHPRREANTTHPRVRVISVEVEPGVRVGGHLHSAGVNFPLLLLFHGNGELAEDYDEVASLFTALDLSLLVMDYRGYGMSDGRPSTSSLLGDAVTIFDALPDVLPTEYCRPERIVVFGRSIGSAAALEVAHRRGEGLAGLVVESGFAFTQPLLARRGIPLDEYDEQRDGHGNAKKIADFHGPTLIIHGRSDGLIDPDQARTLYELSGAPKKELVLIPYANHNNLMIVGHQQYFDSLRAFITSLGNPG